MHLGNSCFWTPSASCKVPLYGNPKNLFIISSNADDRRKIVEIIKNVITSLDFEWSFAIDMENYSGKLEFCTNICTQIRNSRLIVADLSGELTKCPECGAAITCTECKSEIDYCPICDTKTPLFSPNVFWEYGYAAGLGKEIILLCEDSQSLPFNIHDKQPILYNEINLEKILKQEIEKMMQKDIIHQSIQLFLNNELKENLLKIKLKHIISEEKLEQKLKTIKEIYLKDLRTISEDSEDQEYKAASNPPGGLIVVDVRKVDWEEYNKNIANYINDLRAFIQERNQSFEERNRIIKFDLLAINRSTQKIKDIDIYLFIPKDCKFLEELPQYDIYTPPKLPKRPLPKFQFQGSDKLINPFSNLAQILPVISHIPRIPSPYLGFSSLIQKNRFIGENGTVLRYHIDALKQGCLEKIEDIIVKLPIPLTKEIPAFFFNYNIIVGKPSENFKDKMEFFFEY